MTAMLDSTQSKNCSFIIKIYHARSKLRKSTPTHGCGHGSLPRSPKLPSVSTSVAIHSGNGNNTPKNPTPSGNENSPGKGVLRDLPLKNIPVQHIYDSRPKPITHRAVKKEIENGSEIVPSDLTLVQTSDFVFVCTVCKECFGKSEFVREHQELIHVEFKFAWGDNNCFRIFKTKCGQKKHWENKYKITNNENGAVTVKQEEDPGNVPEQLNVSNV